ncbi:MAG: type II toxin-antitoxin system PemK/MazF family toxin [Lachnospiraceae bacterium]|jgi:mRNA interferase MazF|nr:type II toxin-antitoxin system PemK/MazF family toxin [Lachnospiraceae bacterium]
MNKRYIPKQRDLVWINFDPSIGREIQKRRPALVVSDDKYNRVKGFVVVCPITSTMRDGVEFVLLSNQSIKGQVISTQLYSFDYLDKNRDIEYIEKVSAFTFLDVAQKVTQIFNFNFYQI